MNKRILITGSSGLVGTAVSKALEARGVAVDRLDLRETGESFGDVRDLQRVASVVDRCDGVVHLAAVSRVVAGEREPALCRATNVGGVNNVLQSAATAGRRPWVIFASSREVYGQPEHLPVNEDCPVRPVNVYGRSKVAGEELVEAARREGLRACTIRLSNVYGTTADHADRVVPAFARGAAMGEELRVDGSDHTFDFTHIHDVARGIVKLAELLETEQASPPPIHFVSGRPTTLGELAALAIELAGGESRVREAPPRDFDVARFFGDPTRARELLGWKPEVELEIGVANLINEFRENAAGFSARETNQ